MGGEDIQALRHFLDGYLYAKMEEGIEDGAWLYDGFRQWLADRYQDNRSLGWDGLILHHEDSDDALRIFYRLPA